MSLSASIRKKLLDSFRVELSEHIQTITDGLLAMEQGKLGKDERRETLDHVFRAAHSLKGAARAVGATMIEQLAHALESVLDGIREESLAISPALFNTCYKTLDTLQLVQEAYEAGETTPPAQAMIVLGELQAFIPKKSKKKKAKAEKKAQEEAQEEEENASMQEKVEQVFAGEVDVPDSDPPLPASSSAKGNATLQKAKSQPTQPLPFERTANEKASSGDETIRVGVSKLDALMAQLSELLVLKLHAEQRLVQVKEIQEQITLWQKNWFTTRSAYNRLSRYNIESFVSPTDAVYAGISLYERNNGSQNARAQHLMEKDTRRLLNYVTANQEQLRDVGQLVSDLTREYTNDTMQMALAIDKLEQEIKRVRMLPLSTITQTFARMVRDLGQEANKQVVLQVVGQDTELDKRILEQIKDPLIHLLRNAVDHGIEDPEDRKALGKPTTGVITLSAKQVGQDIIVSVADDGTGLDLEAIRQSLLRQGIEGVEALSDAELEEAIFNPGISTSPIITDISGRGLGLDVVRRNLDGLHGRINTTWQKDVGTTFSLVIPLTLTSSRGLLVQIAGELFVIPHSAIDRILSVRTKDIFSFEGQDTIYYDEEPVSVVRLSDLLELQKTSSGINHSDIIPMVIVSAADRRMAFVVDETTGEQEVVVKGLGKQLLRVGGITGATVMGDGRVVLILNVGDLIRMALRGKRRSILDALSQAEDSVATRIRQKILIVDDSITTRMLEKNILEAAGYNIQVATDGQEAVDLIASHGVPDLVVSDIAMPRMNGFDLTRRIKSDAQTARIPVILVTSLDSSEDKARGIEVGADAYIIKSQFDQNNLLETIEQLI